METNNLVQLLFIFLPGIAGVILINFAIASEKKLQINEGIAYSFVLGTLCYLPLNIFGNGQIFNTLLTKTPLILPKEIATALFLALIYSLIIIYIINKELYHLILRKYKLSNKLGKKYLLQGLISSTDKEINELCNRWVSIRYQNKEQVYIGYLKAINVTDQEYFEILIKEVAAYFDSKDTPSYHLEALYLCEKPEDIVLEFHKL